MGLGVDLEGAHGPRRLAVVLDQLVDGIEKPVPFVDDPNNPGGEPVRLYDPDLDPRDPDLIANCLNGGGPFNLEGVFVK